MGAAADKFKAENKAAAAGAVSVQDAASPLGSGSGETARTFSITRTARAYTDSQVGNPNRGTETRAKNASEAFYETDVSRIANLSPQQRAEVNRSLISAGLLDEDTPLGGWGKKNAAALREVYALANDLTADYGSEKPKPFYFAKALELIMGGEGGEGGSGGPKAPRIPPVRLTSEDDLRNVMKEASEKTLGRRLSADEETKFVKYFHGQESAFGSAAQAQHGGTLMEPPTAGAAAEKFAEDASPGEAGAQALSGQLDTFRKLVGSI